MIESPEWMDDTEWDHQSLTDLCRGGCASGCYMPAVTCHKARETMAEHGDAVLQYIVEMYGELPQVPKRESGDWVSHVLLLEGESWSGIAVFYLSVAVEAWAHSELDRLEEAS